MHHALLLQHFRWPSFRLRTLMLAVVVISLGLALEMARRREVERRRLELISSGRRTLVAVHQASAQEFRRQLAEARRQVDVADGKKSGPPYSGGFWSGPTSQQESIEYLKANILDLEKQVAWEDTMVANARWATEHPTEAWPARPPQPVLKSFAEWHNSSRWSRIPNRATQYPFQPVVPGGSKKNQ